MGRGHGGAQGLRRQGRRGRSPGERRDQARPSARRRRRAARQGRRRRSSPRLTGALEGVRVLNLTSVVMGPLATQTLGDLGADVIAIEAAKGETNRYMGTGPHPQLSGIALNLLRNKRNVAIDLKHPSGRDAVLRIAATCDVVVTNLRPAPLARL